METKLGKILRCEFGDGGYQDAMVGVSFVLEGDGWGTCDFWGFWNTERTEHTKWTVEDREKKLGEITVKLAGILKAAKKPYVSKLAGTPIEVTFDGNLLKSWRVLTEVI